MSDSVRPHRRQPTRFLRRWDSRGKNTGVGCHFLLQCMKVKGQSEVAQSCPTLSNPMDCSLPGSSVHGIFQTRVLEWGAIAFSPVYASGSWIYICSPDLCFQVRFSLYCNLGIFSHLKCNMSRIESLIFPHLPRLETFSVFGSTLT